MTVSRKGLILAACGFCIAALMVGAAPQAKPNKVSIKTLPNKSYQLLVNGKPFIVKGVCYSPIPIGKNHEYDWWSDPAKPWITDGKLMKEMGINTIRIYQTGENPEAVKQVIRDLYSLYGIRVILGHWLGFWEYPCPLYGDKRFQDRIKQEVVDMVMLYKDEPGVLFWTLGNENNYSCLGRVNPWTSDDIEKEKEPQKQNQMRAEIYYSYVNDIAKAVHAVDANHPVALGNGELVGLETAAKMCTDVDLIACIIYRGKTFGNLFKSLRMTFDKPIVLSEIGADAYDAYMNKEDQNMQAFFLESQWRQIYENVAGRKTGEGNCLGGVIFEWTDEWWKHNDSDPAGWSDHSLEPGWSNGQYYFDIKAKDNKNMNEEWFGIVALSSEIENGINKRVPRKAYYVIREFWKNPGQHIGQKQKAKTRKQ
ncbi:MAG TPA: glycoside hydrolase family 2 TIM barrel-domain containing protein [Candidatus Omnitrophota bacterium]|nr:glycoside hydrolase family 2 TIM barrel-domain containing protein [Candidatus Omnitrophota bacterium]